MKLSAVFADENGDYFIDDTLKPLGAAGGELWELVPDDLIPLPPGSDLFFLPGRKAVGVNAVSGEVEVIEEEGMLPVAATLPQGYTRLLLPAYQGGKEAPRLPLFGYTALAALGEDLYVAALSTDDHVKWNPLSYNTPDLKELVEARINARPENRILRHLGHCALNYHCLTAQNIFYRRWEGGIPTSPTCNAQCLGCISKQPTGCCQAPQGRITFHPTVEEVVEIARPHLETEEAIISFGQGCEGEPLLAWRTIAGAIREIRKETDKGTININSNAGLPRAVEALVRAGLDSARVSLFSADPESYRVYHRPQNYSLSQVAESVEIMLQAGVFVSLNLLVFPGFTDSRRQAEVLFDFLRAHPVHMVQLRNLNIDPDRFYKQIGISTGEALGVATLIKEMKREFPGISIGNFSRAVR